jgi:hypothetical protein
VGFLLHLVEELQICIFTFFSSSSFSRPFPNCQQTRLWVTESNTTSHVSHVKFDFLDHTMNATLYPVSSTSFLVASGLRTIQFFIYSSGSLLNFFLRRCCGVSTVGTSHTRKQRPKKFTKSREKTPEQTNKNIELILAHSSYSSLFLFPSSFCLLVSPLCPCLVASRIMDHPTLTFN